MPNIATGTNTIGVRLKAGSAPGTPPTGYADVYVKTDGRVYIKTDAGTEYDLTTAGGGANAGWSASNVTTDKTFDANATSVDELADVVGTLIQALISAGVLSA
ncbi:MAG: hypothetical protein SGI73_04470 [Chloroflexota bacterium]|nr:hypothetical protein [Chloroflexota bacterium]